MESESVRVQKLKNAEGWRYWKFKISAQLKRHKVFRMVTGDESKPVAPVGAGSAAPKEEDVAAYQKELQKWQDKDDLA